MTYDEAIKFEKEIANASQFSDVELTDERLGYAAGWLYNRIMYKSGKSNSVTSLTHHMENYDQLKKHIIQNYKMNNKNLSMDDTLTTKLLGYVVEGCMIHTDDKINADVQNAIVFGYNAH